MYPKYTETPTSGFNSEIPRIVAFSPSLFPRKIFFLFKREIPISSPAILDFVSGWTTRPTILSSVVIRYDSTSTATRLLPKKTILI